MRTQKMIFHRSFVFILFSGMTALSVTAQTEIPKRIIIGDHRFTPITYSPLPATKTYINTMAGLGQIINLFHPIAVHEDLGVVGLQGEVTFADMHLGYQQRIRDWLAA